MQRSGLTLLATGLGIVALATSAAVSAAPFRAESDSISGRIEARLRIASPGPVTNKVSPNAPPGPTGKETRTGQGATLKGTFSITGAVRDTGSLVMQMPAPEASSPAMRITLRGKRGSLRISVAVGKALGPSRTSAPPKARWRITSATGGYAEVHGSGRATLSPRLVVLVGVVSSA